MKLHLHLQSRSHHQAQELLQSKWKSQRILNLLEKLWKRHLLCLKQVQIILLRSWHLQRKTGLSLQPENQKRQRGRVRLQLKRVKRPWYLNKCLQAPKGIT
ncbi:uncharacterized protein ACNLHF_013336 [Anomaloglossus baeobatrachus]